ncbi:hypothetical protein E4U43_001567 [Claviceps pusilla]|uniref:Uncharacterized protein n=1 Tax=Claviceps pusilla TaxID=123648 RepID=A0A9P7N8S2_9HYPO|nr:hypothetical protein E4U43_001567 [Claviceps pusilla]
MPPPSLRAAAALAAPARFFSSSSPCALHSDPNRNRNRNPNPNPNPTRPSWPLLQKRSRPERNISSEGLPDGLPKGTASPPGFHKSPRHQDAEAAKTTTTTTTTTTPDTPKAGGSGSESPRDPRIMLTISGLSPSLNASDFYRLAPSDLSSWQSAIRKIQQQRDATSLEPVGQYNLSFSTGPAAISYRDRLLRLHKLAQHRLDNVHGLWESLVPLHLQSAAGDDPATELQGFTVASGCPGRAPVEVQRRRVTVTHPWARVVEQTMKGLVEGYGEKPPVVLVRVYPPTATAADLERWIREDGVSRGCGWDVCPPRALRLLEKKKKKKNNDNNDNSTNSTNSTTNNNINNGSSSSKDNNGSNMAQGRFIVVCANDVEARRFHRRWNQRVIPAGPENTTATRNVVHASIINW